MFRLPGRVAPLGEWLARLWPEVARGDRRAWLDAGRVRVDGVRVDRGATRVAPGARVEIEGGPGAPPWPMEAPETGTAFVAWVDDARWWRGRLGLPGDRRLAFEVTARAGGFARLVLVGDAATVREVADALAAVGWPVVGDRLGGGLAWPGGAWLAMAADRSGAAAARDLLPAPPDEIAWRPGLGSEASAPDGAESRDPETKALAAPVLRVSAETARALASGHPWILPDAASEPATRFAPGTLVRVESRAGDALGQAYVEAERRLAARVWSAGTERSAASVDARVARALARRRPLLVPRDVSGTDAHRLIHGEADELPGVAIDRLGPLLRVLVSGRASDGFLDAVLGALRAQLPVSPEGHAWSVLEVRHVRAPGRADFDRVRFLEGDLKRLRASGALPGDDDHLIVSERGLRFAVDPGWHAPAAPRPGFGLFVDQRENRARLAADAAAGGRWLNLFAHTGAFSVALLAAGAEHVTSVDLSAPWLDRLERNLALNREQGVDPARHEARRGDVRHVLETLPEQARYRGVVVDPPTAAAAGRRFWSVRQDLEPLLGAALRRVEPGGVLLVTQNRSGPPLGLDRILERLARRGHRPVEAIEPAPAGADHPERPGFPEGAPFEGWLMRLGGGAR